MVGVIGNTMLVRGDLAGQYPVFYRYDGHGLVFSSHAGRVAPGGRFASDSLWLLTRLICPDVHEAAAGRTAYTGVRRLPSGATLRIGRDVGSRPEIWPPNLPSPHSRDAIDEVAVELRDRLVHAVATRVATVSDVSGVSADFSGGLDSTSLAYLLSRHTSPLSVFTYFHTRAPVAGDLDRALALAEHDPRFEHHLVEGFSADLPYVGLTTAPIPDEPQPTSIAPARDLLRLRAVAATGSTAHFTGEGGDALFAAPPAYLADLARTADLRRLHRDTTAWARLRHRAPTALMLRAARASRVPLRQAMRKLADRIESGHSGRALAWEDRIGYWAEPGEEIAWLTVRSARVLATELREQALTAALPEGTGTGDYASRAELAASGAASRVLRSRARPYGLAVHTPYLDDEIVQACLRVSARDRGNAFAPKELLRQALRYDVPPRVLSRRTKGDYTAEAYHGVRVAAPELSRLLAAPACADLGIIEPAPVLDVLSRARLGLPIPWPALDRLLAIEVWLRRPTPAEGRNRDE
jgi:asparagine synthase (glutamine-hydrolysing)